MKVTVSTTFDLPDEQYQFDSFTKADAAQSAIHTALGTIRTRLKYSDDVSEQERVTLEDLRTVLLDGVVNP